MIYLYNSYLYNNYYHIKYTLAKNIGTFKDRTQECTYRNILDYAQIIDDAFYFLMKDKLNLIEFLKLTEYLSKESNYIA